MKKDQQVKKLLQLKNLYMFNKKGDNLKVLNI